MSVEFPKVRVYNSLTKTKLVHTLGSLGSLHVLHFAGCIMRGSAVLFKENGRYQRGFVGEYIYGNFLEVLLPERTRSMITSRTRVI